MTYDELFQLKGLEKAKLLAGKSILGREISGAHVVEIVEAQDWVKRGELIFVSGVAFRDVKRDLTEAICELSKKQVAGVVLEVGPYIKEVTDDIIELANELNLPLLSLPYEIHVSEIISQIYYDKYSKEETNKSVEKFMTELLYEDEKKALETLKRVTEKWTPKYPNSMKRWKDNWDAISPIFKFSSTVRKVIYTTNAIESLNSTYRKLNRQRSVFPSDTALLKALYLATFEATKKWTSTIRNWAQVYGELSIMYEGRLSE